MTATCTRGTVVTMRPLPSLVTSTTLPVSATPRFTPVMPRSASRNRRRSSPRAKAVSSSGSVVRSVSPASASKVSAIW